MISTNLLTFELSFTNTSETIIFNVTNKSAEELKNYIKGQNLRLNKVKQFDRTASKFKTISKARLFECVNYYTELHEFLKL